MFTLVGVRGEAKVDVECLGSTDELNVEVGIDNVGFLKETV